MKHAASAAPENARHEASAAVQGGHGLGNEGDGQDVDVEAPRLHAQAHVHAGASCLARKLNRVGPQDVGVALEDEHWRQRGKIVVQGADARICGVQVPRPRASRPRSAGDAQALRACKTRPDRSVRARNEIGSGVRTLAVVRAVLTTIATLTTPLRHVILLGFVV